MTDDGSLKRLHCRITKNAIMIVCAIFYWITYVITTSVLESIKPFTSKRTMTHTHVGHTQWVAKSQSLDHLGG
jgi:hypothetical protein